MRHDNYSNDKKEIIQSYILTTARYEFNVYEKRLLYRVVEMIQHMLQGLKLNQRYRINKQIFEFYEVEMPFKALLHDEDDTNHARIKDALRRMAEKRLEYEDEKVWKLIPLILVPEIVKHDSLIKFKLHEDVYDAFLNFSKGFKKYELKTAFQFESVYAMRFYEMFSNQKTPLIFSIDELKLMFGLEKKYTLNADFLRRVVDAAKIELDKKSPYSFDYHTLKKGKKIISIKFFPVQRPENIDEEFETARLKKQITPSFLIDRHIVEYLKEHYMFSPPEIKNNIDVFELAVKTIPDLLMFLSEVRANANRAKNPKGYLINALKTRLNIKKTKKNAPTIPASKKQIAKDQAQDVEFKPFTLQSLTDNDNN